jgi:hypothetical protein
MCTALLPPGVNRIAVNKYIISKIHYHVYKIPPLGPTLSQINPINALPKDLSTILINQIPTYAAQYAT